MISSVVVWWVRLVPIFRIGTKITCINRALFCHNNWTKSGFHQWNAWKTVSLLRCTTKFKIVLKTKQPPPHGNSAPQWQWHTNTTTWRTQCMNVQVHLQKLEIGASKKLEIGASTKIRIWKCSIIFVQKVKLVVDIV